MKEKKVASTGVARLNPKNYPIPLDNGGKIILEVIPTGFGDRILKETVLIPHKGDPPVVLKDRGQVMTEIVSDGNGGTYHKPVLLIEKSQRPGVWHNGVERPRKQMVYDLIEGVSSVHPRDDVRNKV